jgi:hypothetical protein
MQLNQRLYDCMSGAAHGVSVAQVIIGIGYTAVSTSNGHVGIAATDISVANRYTGDRTVADFESRPAVDLLACILTDDPVQRSMALALINALNRPAALALAEDPANRIMFDRFGILAGAKVAMVGYFPPLVRFLEAQKIPLTVIDDGRGIGDKTDFYQKLQTWADVLLLTATSLLNNTTEAILAHAGSRLKTVMLGPSTPMLPDVFHGLPVHMLAGSAITDGPGTLKIIRHGGGARDLKPVLRKVYQVINTPAG